MNALFGKKTSASGSTSLSLQTWAIDTFAGNGSKYGKVLDANLSRKRVTFTAAGDLTTNLWGPGENVWLSTAAETNIYKGAAILGTSDVYFNLDFPTEVAVIAQTISGSDINGTITYPPFTATSQIANGNIPPVSIMQFVLERWTGEVFMCCQAPWSGVFKLISILEES